jgi:hypothetical protein
MLISLLERAYLLLYEHDMSSKQMRRWSDVHGCTNAAGAGMRVSS